MTTRRSFLGISLAGAAMPLVPGIAAAQSAIFGEASLLPVYKAVFDQRFSESVIFGEAFADRQVATAGINGDITNLWFKDLDLRWRQGAAMVSGLTTSGPLFCMEQMMGQYGLRLAFRGEHQYMADGSVRHRLSGDPAILLRAAGLVEGGRTWSRHLAGMLHRLPSHSMRPTQLEVTTPHAASKLPAPSPLYSWLLAPATRA